MAKPAARVTSRFRRVDGGVWVRLTEHLDLTSAQLGQLRRSLGPWARSRPRTVEARCRAVRSSLDPLGYRQRPDEGTPEPCCLQVRAHLTVPERADEIKALVRDLLEVADLVEKARSSPN